MKRAIATCGLILVAATCGDDRGGEPGGDEVDYVPPHAQQEPPVVGYLAPPAAVAVEPMPAFKAPAPVWPEPGKAALRVDGASGATVEPISHAVTAAAGIDGVVMRVAGALAGGPVRLTVDYGAFRYAHGGDWASRLSLWLLPECALVNPGAPACRGQQLATVNDAGAGTVSAVADVGQTALALGGTGGMLVMAAAGAAGAGGDYSATSLAPASTWEAGGNSGDFSWTYPLRMPPALGGPAPRIELAYSSSSVDGRMASTNNQASWVGEGFDWQPGAIERRYNGCADDMASGANNTVKTGDQCWVTDNASLSLAGHAGELLKDATNPNLWHLRHDDGTRVEHRTGGPNGDNDGEWWIVTTPDGVQSWFGGRAGSNATLTAPVYGNHAGEPCHQAAFKDSSCTQAYRWLLDRVVDPMGNTLAITYAKETNKYGRNNTTTDAVVYDRDAYPAKIEYGTRTDSTGAAPMQVVFGVADRCLSGCSTKDAAHWPDVPWDRECTGASCGLSQNSPSFWSTKRLASITTQVWTGSAYKDVDVWTLSHSFPMSDQPTLWLDRIAHQGKIGGTATLPDVTLSGVALGNRVDTNTDQYPAMMRYRVKSILSETGGKIDVTYSAPDCVKGTRVPDQNALQNNALRCYPVKWTPDGLTSPINDFFHKYLVTDVTNSDLSGSSSRVRAHYDYLGDPAWHYTDDDGLIKADFKTWGVWRGYAAVRTIKGDPGEQTSEERRYFRGMHGDHLPSGTRTVVLAAIATGNVPAVNDEDAFAGQQREVITYDGPGGAEVTGQATEPYQSAPTATRTINGVTVTARHVDTAVVHARTTRDGGRATRTTATTTTYDALGAPIQIDDSGDQAITGDERCTLIEYARNTAANLIDRRSRERAFGVSCAQVVAGGLTDDDVIGETRTSFDGQAWNAAPTQGLPTRVETMLAYNGGAPTFVADHVYTHDSYGRTLTSTDIRGNTLTTAFVPASGGPVTATSETNALGWVKSVTLEPAWGLPLATIDANGRKVELAYDALGRLSAVWLNGRDRASSSANITYDYLVRANAPTVITSRRLNAAGGYITSYKLFDNLMRDRQAQAPDEAGGAGAVITDTFYDSAGRQVKVHDRYLAVTAGLAPVPPSTELFVPTQNIPRLTVTQYDGAGRQIAAITKVDGPPASAGGTELWRTTTAYGGDRTDVTPPAGGTPTSTFADVRGETTELRQYQPGHAAGSATGFDRTTYGYDRKGKLARLTDPAGNTWTYAYDLRGHKIRDVDPDKGTTTTVYNTADDIVSTTDGRGVTLAYTYDVLGRKVTMRDGSPTGAKRAEWFYDRLSNGTPVTGILVKTIRYDGADQYSKEFLGFTADYQPTSATFTIPSSALAAGVNGSYTYVHTYNPDGSTATTRQPALGDLGLETLSYGYNALGKPTSLGTSLGATLIAAPDASTPATEYTSLGELAVLHLRNNSGAHADIVRTYDTQTRRLAQIWTTRATGPATVADVRYSYDPMGNVTKVSDLTASDHQCFAMDHLRRLTTAWTPASGDCSAAPATGALGGPAAYWHSYSYDAVGNRTELVEHVTPAGLRDTTYTVPAGKHRLTATSTVDGTGTHSRGFTYDAAGNMLTRTPVTGSAQTLTWNAEGLIATSQDATGTTSYLYDVDGTRLIRKDPTGTTLYLPGQELRFSGGTRKGTRYYGHANEVIAMRTASGVTWLSGDHHETAQVAINAVDQTAAIRRETPFGELRVTTGTWPAGMDKGFVGGTNEASGLTHLGAREYDPTIGRFISVDPVIDSNDPQQLHGYAYSNNSPITAYDPDGKFWKQLGSVAKTVFNAPVKAAGWVNDHAGEISAVTGVLALGAALMPPPIDLAAPILEATSIATGALAAANDCSAGKKLSCGLDVVGMIPGARFVTKLGKSAGAAKAFAETGDLLADAMKVKGGEVLGMTTKVARETIRGWRAEAYADMVGNPFIPEHPESLKDWAWWSFSGLIELSHVAHITVEQNKEYVDHRREREDEARVHNHEASHETTYSKPTHSLYSPTPAPPMLPPGRGTSRGGFL
jgi:RHS repeat-associated protein